MTIRFLKTTAALAVCGLLLAFPATAQQAPSHPLSQAQVAQLQKTAAALLDRKVIDWAIATLLAADPPDTRPHIVVFDHQARWKKISATLDVARALAGAGMLAKSMDLYRRSGIEAVLDNADGDTERRWARTRIAYYARVFNKGLLGGGPGVVPQAQEFAARLERLVAGDPKAKEVIEKGIAEIKKYPYLAEYSPDSCGSSPWENIVEDINYIGSRAPIPDDYKDFEGRPKRVVNYEAGSAAVSAATKGRMSEKDAMLVGTIGQCVAYHSLSVRRDVALALEQIANTIDAITENSRVAANAALAAHGTTVGSEQRMRREFLQQNNGRQVEGMVSFLAWLALGMPNKSDTKSKQSAAPPATAAARDEPASSAKPGPQPKAEAVTPPAAPSGPLVARRPVPDVIREWLAREEKRAREIAANTGRPYVPFGSIDPDDYLRRFKLSDLVAQTTVLDVCPGCQIEFRIALYCRKGVGVGLSALKGKKIYSFNYDKMMREFIYELDAELAMLPASELYLALRTNTIDCLALPVVRQVG